MRSNSSSKENAVFANILTTKFLSNTLQKKYDKQLAPMQRQNCLLFFLVIQIIIIPMIFYNAIEMNNINFTIYLIIMWIFQFILYIISRLKQRWIEALIFIQIMTCGLAYIIGSKWKSTTDHSKQSDVQFLNGNIVGIILLLNQYIQTNTILKIMCNLIAVCTIFIVNNTSYFIRVSLLLCVIIVSVTIHYKDKYMKIQFFNHQQKSQHLKGWQRFISEELPQSVFIVSKKDSADSVDNEFLKVSTKKNGVVQEQQNNNLRNKNSTAFTHQNSSITKSRIRVPTSSVLKKNEQESTKNRNMSFIQNGEEQALPSYDIVFMNKKCKQFISGRGEFDTNFDDLIQDTNINCVQQNNEEKSYSNSALLNDLKYQLQKLFIQRKREQLVSQNPLSKYELQSSPLKKIIKKKSFFFTEKERISLHQLIQQCLSCFSYCNHYSDKSFGSSINNVTQQNQTNSRLSKQEMLGGGQQENIFSKHNIFSPKMIEHHVNCQHFQPNTYFDLKIYECNYHDKSSLMIIIDDISKKVIDERLRDVETYKEKLLSMITHNLKTPLNGILCILESIDLKQEKVKVDTQTINIALQNSKLLSFMINDLIDYSCIMKGDLTLNPRYFKVQDCVTILEPIFKEQLRYKQIEFNILINKDIENLLIYNDQQRFLQILVNLISNSLKYTFRGHITLTIEECADYENMIVSVSDTGIGMRESTIKQLSASTENIYRDYDYQKGMGLGLQLISNLVQKVGPTQNLKIDTSNQDSGTTIQFSMYKDIMMKKSLCSAQLISMNQNDSPLHKALKIDLQHSCELYQTGNEFLSQEQKEEVRCIPPRERQKSYFRNLHISLTQSQDYFKERQGKSPKEILCDQLKNKKIMIVDDTVFNILALKVLLQNIPNLQISEACNGQQAVTLFKQSVEYCKSNQKQNSDFFIPEIIFMDINMPIMDGIQATKEINEFAKLHQVGVKIITVSAFNQEQDRENFLVAGSHFHVAKPIKVESLTEALSFIGI